MIQVINFRLRVTDQRKQRRDKPAHKENEAIEFEFNLEQDECMELTSNMVIDPKKLSSVASVTCIPVLIKIPR